MEKAEQERQMQEAERVDRSQVRVENENVRVAQEEGRVHAEEERELAEKNRTDVRGFYLKTAAIIAMPLAFVALIPSLIGIYLVQRETDKRTSENRAAIVYICSTTTVLDDLVVEVSKSLKANLESGFYDQLIANGTLPPGAKAQAKVNLQKYNEAHARLSDTKPCKKIE